MKIAVSIIAMLYGLVSAAAPLSQMKDKEKRLPSVIMLCGGLTLILGAVLKLLSLPCSAAAAAAGALAICVAVMNGLKNKKLHVMHHVIRLLISCALVAGFLLF